MRINEKGMMNMKLCLATATTLFFSSICSAVVAQEAPVLFFVDNGIDEAAKGCADVFASNTARSKMNMITSFIKAGLQLKMQFTPTPVCLANTALADMGLCQIPVDVLADVNMVSDGFTLSYSQGSCTTKWTFDGKLGLVKGEAEYGNGCSDYGFNTPFAYVCDEAFK